MSQQWWRYTGSPGAAFPRSQAGGGVWLVPARARANAKQWQEPATRQSKLGLLLHFHRGARLLAAAAAACPGAAQLHLVQALPTQEEKVFSRVGGWVWGKSEADTVHPEEDGACWRASLIQLAEFILGTPPHLYPGEAGKGLRLGFKFTCAQPMGYSVQSSSHFYIWDALGKPPSMLHCRMGLGGWWKGRSRLPRPGPSLGMCLSLTE